MIELTKLNKTFHLKTGDVAALRDVSLTIEEGGIYGVIGYSGAGKSTLVRCLNLLEVPDSGVMRIAGRTISFRDGFAYAGEDSTAPRLKEKQLNALRRGIGMIFQHFNLLDRSTVFENVAYPLRYTGRSRSDIARRVLELLELVGLSEKAYVYPSQLSGGQKQRVAIARALANEPGILLSDEATSALDPDATESILNLLRELNRKLGITIILITHEMAVIKAICQRVAVMEDGCVAEEGSVYDIFAHPQAAITRRFVHSTSSLGRIDKLMQESPELLQLQPGQQLVKLTFERNSVGDHVLTSAARKYGFDFSVILANVELLEGSPLGGMIGIASGDGKAIEQGLAYWREHNVLTEVIGHGA